MTDIGRRDPTALTGVWNFSRVIDDRASNQRSTAVGRTRLEIGDDGAVRWFESGTLTLAGQDLPFTRTLHVVPREGTWFVTFEDGRTFHRWLPGEEVEHLCGADAYRGTIELDDDGSADPISRWTVQWVVHGPGKDYTMTTVLTLRP